MNGLEGNGYQRHLSLYNKGVCVAQEKQDFPVILSSDYLAVPNNLLLSLSLSLSLSLRRYWRNFLHKHLIIRAREKRRNAFGQGTRKRFRCLFCRARWPSHKDRFKEVLTTAYLPKKEL
ncbi:hypothetical protein [Prevotella sp. kh1p2]|uniref:hypothetical protein n=1 Tax=Prevotella sp. kh1p2 TaxID=1761883 RepID=UPI00115FD909|nr:hypothetical protein [Prevotella sp. kh1p2]